jgi:hypothetical protein
MSDYWKNNNLIKPDPWVVCAANMNRTSSRIICGARHWDNIMRSQKLDTEDFTDWEQGFINQFGEFLTRDEAWIIAEKNGQIKSKCYDTQDSHLFSENLY